MTSRQEAVEQELAQLRVEELELKLQSEVEKEKYCKEFLRELRYRPEFSEQPKGGNRGGRSSLPTPSRSCFFVRSGSYYISLHMNEIQQVIMRNQQESVQQRQRLSSQIGKLSQQLS